MNTFEIAGVFFIVMGGIQSLLVLSALFSERFRKQAVIYLFLVMGILLVLTGFWMLTL